MEQAGTPCPFEGKIGKQAKAAWKKYDKLRPDYDQYVNNLKIIEKKNEEETQRNYKQMTKWILINKSHEMKVKQKVEWESPK